MYVPFEALSADSRIWIYQANRMFNSVESSIISQALSAFTERWVVHGTPLRASFQIQFSQVVVLAADEMSTGVSGCSIDDSVRTLKALGNELQVDFFDRTLVNFKVEDRLFTIPMAELKQKHVEGFWDDKTLVVNPLIQTKGDLITGALVPAGSTWLKRYLPRESVAS